MVHLVIGASLKTYRYSNIAIKRLRQHNYEVKALGLRNGEVGDVIIEVERKALKDVDTVLLYLNPQRQKEIYDYVLGLKPRRIIFNPGTENPEFEGLAESKGIKAIEACSLVMLSTGEY